EQIKVDPRTSSGEPDYNFLLLQAIAKRSHEQADLCGVTQVATVDEAQRQFVDRVDEMLGGQSPEEKALLRR
ncbi:unnamed protein product, partial [Amoebophrya sp. A25]